MLEFYIPQSRNVENFVLFFGQKLILYQIC